VGTFRKLAWLLVALSMLISGYFGVVRLRKRAEVRRELATLARTDQIELAEFLAYGKNNPSASQRESYEAMRQQVESRNERIKTLLMVDPGPYIKAQETLLDLMRKENEFVRLREAYLRALNELPGEIESLNMQVNMTTAHARLTDNLYNLTHDRQAALRDSCEQGKELQKLIAQMFETNEALQHSPELVESAQREASRSWDNAYGWIRWSGVPIEPSNPIRAYPPTILSPDIVAAIEHTRLYVEPESKRLKDVMSKGCQ